MTFTAKHYSQIAAGYEKAAADPSITTEKREEFSRKAEWFRFLAEREGRALPPGGTPGPPQDGPRTEASVEGSANERSFRPFLTSLWVLGGAVYLIATVLFINVVINRISHNPFSAEDARKPIAEVKPPAPTPGAVASNEGSTGQSALPPSSPAPARPHAISPDEPSYEAPGLIVPPSFPEQEQTASAPGPETAPAAPPPSPSGPEFKVTGTAKVRNGPAPESEAIGSATVTPAPSTHENTAAPAEEVPSISPQPKPEPAPPASPEGETSVTVTRSEEAPSATQQPKPKPAPPASPAGETSVTATRSEEAPSLTSEKPKPAKKRARQKPSEPTEAAKQRQPELFEPDPDRDYADLPEQEDVLSNGPPPRMGFFAKRRTLREGLLSPDFIPPQ